MTPIIETERLILREFSINDYKDVYAFNASQEVQEYTGDKVLASLDDAKELIKNVWHADYKKYGYGRWAVVHKAENKVIGFAGLKYLPEFNETDIGFRFLPAYWGKGLATEASREIIKYGFEKLNLDKIIGMAIAENIASCKVLEKIGLTFYKIADYDGDGIDCNWYKIDKSSYLQQ